MKSSKVNTIIFVVFNSLKLHFGMIVVLIYPKVNLFVLDFIV